ncbi:MAG: hypothetical protein RR533_03630 [Carnobacterium sp.]
MSAEADMSIDVNVYEVMDFYADVFQVENTEVVTYNEKSLDPDVVIFNKELNRYDKLKENGQVELEKITKDFYQVEIHELV